MDVKLASALLFSTALPVLGAYFYGQRPPEPLVPDFHVVEEADRIFLAELEGRNLPLIAVTETVPVRAALPVASAPIREVAPVETVRVPRAEAPVPSSVPAAIPVRASATQNLTTAGAEPEVRRAIPVTSHRASILIYRGEVVVSPPVRRVD